MTFPLYTRGVSTRPIQQNIHCIQWGPNHHLAVASGEFVSIYRKERGSLKMIHQITKHKSPVTSICWNFPSLEITQASSFQFLLAVGDESGNCLIYDINSGRRHAGISPEHTNMNVSIVDIKWSTIKPSIIYILTSAPSLMCFEIGSFSRRRSSSVENCGEGIPFISFNLTSKFYVNLNVKMDFILCDHLKPLRLIIAGASSDNSSNNSTKEQGNIYAEIKLSDSFNIASFSKITQFPGSTSKKLINCEFFPFDEDRLVLQYPSSISIYNMKTKTGSQIVTKTLQDLCIFHNTFRFMDPKKFVAVDYDGIIYTFRLENDKWTGMKSVNLGSHVVSAAIDPYSDKAELAVMLNNGSIAIFTEFNKKYVCTHYYPAMYGVIEAFTSDTSTSNGKMAFALSKGFIDIFEKDKYENCPQNSCQNIKNQEQNKGQNNRNLKYHECISDGDQRSRYLIDEQHINSIHFLTPTKVAIEAAKLYLIDLVTKSVAVQMHSIVPHKLSVSHGVMAFSHLPNIINFIFKNGTQKTSIFTDNIKFFVPNYNIENVWLVFLTNGEIYILNQAMEKHKIIINENIGDINGAIFINDVIYFVTSRSILYCLNTTTKSSTNLHFSEFGLVGIKYYPYADTNDISNYLLVIDAKKNCGLVKIEKQYKLILLQICPYKVINVRFFDSNYVLLQTSNSIVRISQIPSFVDYVSANYEQSGKIPFVTRSALFSKGKTFEDFEKMAQDSGDLSFIQLTKIIQKSGNLPYNSQESVFKNQFIESQTCLSACEYASNPNQYVEYLILENRTKDAANFLLTNNQNANIISILLAHTILAPNEAAITEILQKVPISNEAADTSTIPNKTSNDTTNSLVGVAGVADISYLNLASLFLVLSKKYEEAVTQLFEMRQDLSALKYAKFLFDEKQIHEFSKKVLTSNKLLYFPELLAASMGDIHACVGFLYRTAQITKAYACIKFVEERKISVFHSEIADYYKFDDYAKLKEMIIQKWESNLPLSDEF
ncbi:hypothetical protein TRFO_20662 [Tritrichomonas foetus]|uniref:Uncharacterized protein n=1 Tax=Tritrichomonas foetus TaxID=1144522 RepID=A0A1J4KF98_9EUKA|nr:hypothetical protein TRFO_20662 [Tritrichomonas foetus]|eukprot:OHT10129.1 hypothetical protein TRFO_20662 [Tritrichomonas foetus]